MDTYIDELAPWERRKAYYNSVKLGKSVDKTKEILKNQTQEMITAQITSTDAIISSQDRSADAIHDISYNLKSVGQGIRGLKAAFEWGISDVVWLIEKDTEDLKNAMMSVYMISDKQMEELRDNADEAYAKGKIEDALGKFLEVEKYTKTDFSNCISLGMIYLFHKIDKEQALDYFERAIKYVRPLSAYYASYALLYEALIKHDLGLIEEAEKCTREAIGLSPDFVEAMYRNAQYNALLNEQEKAIPLLKNAIESDIVYCLKINSEPDFNEMRPEITELFEELRNKKNEKVKERLEEEKKSVILLNNASKGVQKLGYDVPKASSVDFFQDGNNEIDKMVKNNSIFDAHIAIILLSLLSKKLQRKKSALRMKCNEIHRDIDGKIQELSVGLAGKKKKGGLSFILYFLCGQIVALPFGWYIGMPLGIYITEGLLFFVCLYVSVILPQSRWKDVHAKQSEKDRLERVMRKL